MKSKSAKIEVEIGRLRLSLRTLDKLLHRLGPLLSAGTAISSRPMGNGGSHRPRLSARGRASLVLQGRYMGYMRQLNPVQKAQVRKIREGKGVRAAIVRARALSQ